MDLTATLSAQEIEALSNPKDAFESTSRRFIKAEDGQFVPLEAGEGAQTAFEVCLKLKNTLDMVETEGKSC